MRTRGGTSNLALAVICLKYNCLVYVTSVSKYFFFISLYLMSAALLNLNSEVTMGCKGPVLLRRAGARECDMEEGKKAEGDSASDSDIYMHQCWGMVVTYATGTRSHVGTALGTAGLGSGARTGVV